LDAAANIEPCQRLSRLLSALFAAGKLADAELGPQDALARRQARGRYRAAAEYLAMHFAAVAGAGGPQQAKLFGHWYALAMITPPGRSQLLAHQVLERALFYGMPPESAGQEETLRRVLRQFVEMAAQC
jgi:hypothetical protein